MAFRDAPAPEAVITVVHGPFRPRWGRLALGALVFVVFGGLALALGGTTTLRCGAARSGAVRCAIEKSMPLVAKRTTVLERQQMVRLTTVVRTGSRGSSGQSDVVIIDDRGAEHVVATRDDAAAAEHEKERLRLFLEDPSQPTLTMTTSPGWVPWIGGAFALGCALLLIGNGLWTAGSVRIELDRAHDELRAMRSFATWRSRPIRVALADVVDVVLERGPISDRLGAHAQPPEIGGRLAVVDRHGTSTPLAATSHRGESAHAQAFLALRAALRLPVVPVPPPPAPPSAAPAVTRRPWRLVLALFAFAIAAAFVGNVLLQRHANRTQGWLELRADHRCRFQGAVLLPGGMMRMSLDPGRYEAEVWVGGAWQPRSIEVRLGEETVFVCRP